MTSKSSFTQFWLVVTWLREELQIIRKEETQSLQILSQKEQGSPAVTAVTQAAIVQRECSGKDRELPKRVETEVAESMEHILEGT